MTSLGPADIALSRAQACVTAVPVIVLGSGASAAYGIPGMPALRDLFLSSHPPVTTTPADMVTWNDLIAVLKTQDLEAALGAVTLSAPLTRFVVDTTRDYLVPHDIRVLDELLVNRSTLTLTRLYQHLFKSTHTEISVVTPNYDCLAEFAADAGDISHFTGFNCGHLRSRSAESLPRNSLGSARHRMVSIWKVHGSLDWFRDRDGVIVALPVGYRPGGDLEPAIVTPGIQKYRTTHDEPFRTIMQGADAAMRAAPAFLCIGYGFNDEHLQPMLVERCRKDEVPLVLIAKQLTAAAQDFLRGGKCRSYLALEESVGGYKMYCPEYPGGVDVSGSACWSLDQFLTLVT